MPPCYWVCSSSHIYFFLLSIMLRHLDNSIYFLFFGRLTMHCLNYVIAIRVKPNGRFLSADSRTFSHAICCLHNTL
jgi:hypothetical protein